MKITVDPDTDPKPKRKERKAKAGKGKTCFDFLLNLSIWKHIYSINSECLSVLVKEFEPICG